MSVDFAVRHEKRLKLVFDANMSYNCDIEELSNPYRVPGLLENRALRLDFMLFQKHLYSSFFPKPHQHKHAPLHKFSRRSSSIGFRKEKFRVCMGRWTTSKLPKTPSLGDASQVCLYFLFRRSSVKCPASN